AELRWIGEGSAAGIAPPAAVAARRGSRERMGWIVAALGMLSAAAWIFVASRGKPGPPQTLRVSLLPPAGTVSSGPLALSPDGRSVAFVTEKDGRRLLVVRALDTLDPRILPGTEGGLHPFWSPA